MYIYIYTYTYLYIYIYICIYIHILPYLGDEPYHNCRQRSPFVSPQGGGYCATQAQKPGGFANRPSLENAWWIENCFMIYPLVMST